MYPVVGERVNHEGIADLTGSRGRGRRTQSGMTGAVTDAGALGNAGAPGAPGRRRGHAPGSTWGAV